ncbi:hypothetical protein FRC12_024961 [Ceratobasidium sp. 428]|nr:hypothetical protein FRC12_024961 [Ceratobasidium sp. 428]
MQAADLPIDKETEEYLQALESCPLSIVRDSIHECRSSGLRREGLRHTIVEGNRLGRFRLPSGATYMILALELLRNQATRWGSTYNMIKLYLLLYPAVVEYSLQIRNDAHIPVVSHKQYEVLQDLVTVFDIAHNAQELLSAEKTPTLALAFPVYECIVEAWEQLCVAIPELSHAITGGILKIREYINQIQQARVHTLAMAVNPSFRLEWIQEHWDTSRAGEAENTVKQEMLKRQREQGYAQRESQAPNSARNAARAQNCGYIRLLTSASKFQRASSLRLSQVENSPSTTSTGFANHSFEPLIPSFRAIGTLGNPSDIQARNQAIVDEEFTRYTSSGITPVEQMSGLELVCFWKVYALPAFAILTQLTM